MVAAPVCDGAVGATLTATDGPMKQRPPKSLLNTTSSEIRDYLYTYLSLLFLIEGAHERFFQPCYPKYSIINIKLII